MRYTVGPELIEDPYHVDIIKEKLTRTLPVIMPDVVDELELAVPYYIDAKDDGKRYQDTIPPVPVADCRTTCRMDCCGERHVDHAGNRCARQQPCIRRGSNL